MLLPCWKVHWVPFVLQLASHESENQQRPNIKLFSKKNRMSTAFYNTHTCGAMCNLVEMKTPGAFGIPCGLCGWARGPAKLRRNSGPVHLWTCGPYLRITQKVVRFLDISIIYIMYSIVKQIWFYFYFYHIFVSYLYHSLSIYIYVLLLYNIP